MKAKSRWVSSRRVGCLRPQNLQVQRLRRRWKAAQRFKWSVVQPRTQTLLKLHQPEMPRWGVRPYVHLSPKQSAVTWCQICPLSNFKKIVSVAFKTCLSAFTSYCFCCVTWRLEGLCTNSLYYGAQACSWLPHQGLLQHFRSSSSSRSYRSFRSTRSSLRAL